MSKSTSPDYVDYQRYLASKKSVDDRALNDQVWWRLGDSIDTIMSIQQSDHESFRVLELGSGIGTMLERLLENGFLPGSHNVACAYVAVDELAKNGEATVERLTRWAEGWEMTVQQHSANSLQITAKGQVDPHSVDPHSVEQPAVTLTLETADLFDYLARAQRQIEAGTQQPFNLVIAHAFLDLVDAPAALAQIKAVMRPDGYLFTSINFDGATILQPEIDPIFDAHIESLYHRTMDERVIHGKPSGESKTGRHLFGHLRAAGFNILAAGSSDWVVFATTSGEDGSLDYVEDEAYFLHFIVETMYGALKGHPEIDQDKFEAWVAQRHRQIEEKTLIYIAHQLDFLATPHS